MTKFGAYMIRCSWCRKVRKPGRDGSDQDDWERVSAASLLNQTMSDGICPSCREETLPTQGKLMRLWVK